MSFAQVVKNYFDLYHKTSHPKIKPLAEGPSPNSAWPQYLALGLGVIIQPFLDTYLQTNSLPSDWTPIIPRTIFGLVVAIAIFPGVYKRAWDNENPVFVQLCSIFSAGLGWQTLFAVGASLAVA